MGKLARKRGLNSFDERYKWNERLAGTLRKLYYDREADEVESCHRSFSRYSPECGHERVVCVAESSCFHRLCPFCAAIRTRRAIRRLRFVARSCKTPKLITLTLRNVPSINERYLRQVREWLSDLRDKKYFVVNGLKVKNLWKQKVRGGVYSLETTYNAEARTFHVHIHALVDADYLPQKWVSWAWDLVNGHAGYVVDVRKCGSTDEDLLEVVKYISKGDKILDDSSAVAEIVAAVKGQRLLSTFGSFYAFDFKDLDSPPPASERFPECACGSRDPGHWRYIGRTDIDHVTVCVDLSTGESFYTDYDTS